MKKACLTMVSFFILSSSLMFQMSSYAETASSEEIGKTALTTNSHENDASLKSNSEEKVMTESTSETSIETATISSATASSSFIDGIQTYAAIPLIKRISDIFPDPTVAQDVATQLAKNVQDFVTQIDLDKITMMSLEGKAVSSIEGIQYLNNLFHLSLQDSQNVSDLSPLAKGSLKKLRLLYLKGNKISDLTPLRNAGLESLEELYVENNQLTTINGLENLPNLRKLSIQNNQITSIEALRSLRNLEVVWAANNKIPTLEPFAKVTSLKVLYSENNQLSSIRGMENKPNLEELSILNQQVSDLSPLATSPKLRILYAGNNQISDIRTLSHNTELITLTLDKNHLSDISTLKQLTKITNVGLALSDQTIRLNPVDYIADKPFQQKNQIISRDGTFFTPDVISDSGTYNLTSQLLQWQLPTGKKEVSYTWKSTDKAYLGNFSGTVIQPLQEVFLSKTKLSWQSETMVSSLEKTMDVDEVNRLPISFYWQDTDKDLTLNFVVTEAGKEIQVLSDEKTLGTNLFKEKTFTLSNISYGKHQLTVGVYDRGYKIDEITLNLSVVGSVSFKTAPNRWSFGNDLEIASKTMNYPLIAMDQPLVIRDTRQDENNWSLRLTLDAEFQSTSGAKLPNILKFRKNGQLLDISYGQSTIIHEQTTKEVEKDVSKDWLTTDEGPLLSIPSGLAKAEEYQAKLTWHLLDVPSTNEN